MKKSTQPLKGKLLLVTMAIVTSVLVNAQNYVISFAATGDVTSIDNILVENQTQGNSLQLTGNDQLELVIADNPTFTRVYDEKNNFFRIYPVPAYNICRLEFELPSATETRIEILDVSGKSLTKFSDFLKSGSHILSINGLNKGLYIVTVSTTEFMYSESIVSLSNYTADPKIDYAGPGSGNINSLFLKNSDEIIPMNYTPGDQLKFTATAGTIHAGITDTPTESKTITFNFSECIDGDGNSYPVVTIGSQTWMAANLNTSRYSDGTDIPYITDSLEWGSQSVDDKSFCYYHDDPSTGDVYGALYTWQAAMHDEEQSDQAPSGVQGVCPSGWHLPSAAEWDTLYHYYGGANLAGKALKEEGPEHWGELNEGTNESGFTALPGGMRIFPSGEFRYLGESGRWWSTTELLGGDYASGNRFSNVINEIFTNAFYKTNGLSVRCVKD